MIKKEVINADDFEWEIRRRKDKSYGLYLTKAYGRNIKEKNHMNTSAYTISECRNWVFSHFVGEKGTHFSIKVVEETA